MSKFEIDGEAVIPKEVSNTGVIYGFVKFKGRRVQVVILPKEENNK